MKLRFLGICVAGGLVARPLLKWRPIFGIPALAMIASTVSRGLVKMADIYCAASRSHHASQLPKVRKTRSPPTLEAYTYTSSMSCKVTGFPKKKTLSHQTPRP